MTGREEAERETAEGRLIYIKESVREKEKEEEEEEEEGEGEGEGELSRGRTKAPEPAPEPATATQRQASVVPHSICPGNENMRNEPRDAGCSRR